VFDFDGDSKRDLLVGEFGNGSIKFEGMSYARGRLRIYRNVGTEAKPRYDGFEWFKAGDVNWPSGNRPKKNVRTAIGAVREIQKTHRRGQRRDWTPLRHARLEPRSRGERKNPASHF
jgi:hypothetical protein